jgi:hypothetical protein
VENPATIDLLGCCTFRPLNQSNYFSEAIHMSERSPTRGTAQVVGNSPETAFGEIAPRNSAYGGHSAMPPSKEGEQAATVEFPLSCFTA